MQVRPRPSTPNFYWQVGRRIRDGVLRSGRYGQQIMSRLDFVLFHGGAQPLRASLSPCITDVTSACHE